MAEMVAGVFLIAAFMFVAAELINRFVEEKED
jgi:Co/Zn/Cd efflux system component